MDNPLEIRVGSTGAGLFVGCGAGEITRRHINSVYSNNYIKIPS